MLSDQAVLRLLSAELWLNVSESESMSESGDSSSHLVVEY